MSTNTILASAPLTATGYHLKATGTTLGQSLIWDNGTNVGIGNTNTSYTLDVSGTGRFTGNLTAAAFLGNLYTNTWYAGSGSTLSLRTAASGVIADFSPTSSNILGYVGINGSTTSSAALSVYDTTSGSEQLRLCNSTGSGYWGIGRENNITGDLYFNSGGTLRVIFKTAGNVLLGKDVVFGINTSNASDDGYLALCGASGDGEARGGHIYLSGNERSADAGTVVLAAGNVSNGSINFRTAAGVERMRITSGGFTKISNNATYLNVASTYHELRNSTNDDWAVVISQTSSPSPYGLLVKYTGASPNNASNNFLTCSDSTQDKLNIYSNGNVVNRNNSYGLLSDIKLKENIVDATPKLDKLMQVRIVNYNLIADPDLKQIGVIAQELEQVFPALVDEHIDKDDEHNDLGTTTKSVKMSVFVPILIKAIQEMNTKLDEQNQTIQNLQEQINILAK